MDAFAALRREQRNDVVARRDARHALADLLDHAGALVPEHGRRVAGRVRAARGVEVGMTDAAGREAHQHLAELRALELDVLDDERLGELLQDGGANPHGAGP